ncbi:helix-turn-helix transcriptional regulator [Oribacterium sp. WCC10]|uniref:helix-turn-helix transcriptional regulator n=1 Tax=Oribacterium sp. WCC10 TaxID=1855343 RepID=UPI0008EFE5A1|nr:WYL domain-containing protein [Oribacterium sp. WCC10]SFG78344.1 Predicted DNA-binding transcriptional regulator YafY, contains an HTH and WYL domains [Oribacterium sp. WCC10]
MEKPNSKGRILALLRYLQDETDEEHPADKKTIMKALQDKGYSITRNTLDDDIKVLESFEADIIISKSHENTYFLGERKFQLPELKMLIDAISSAKFISADSSEEMISKIGSMASRYQRSHMSPRIFVSDRVKSDNNHLHLVVDVIERAIEKRSVVSFQYIDYSPEKEKILKNDGEIYYCSPYCCLWNNDNYYLLGYSEKHEKVISYRIDRMLRVELCPEEYVPLPDGCELTAFTKEVFKMYDGVDQEVDLICDNALMKNLVDHFGDDFTVRPESKETFRATVKVSVSRTFYAWVFQFAGGIRISGPENVREEYMEMLKNAMK